MTLETSTIGRLRAALRTPVRLGLLMAALAVVALSSAASPVDANDEADLAIYRVTVEDDAQIQTLIDEGYDLLEIREGDDLFVVAGPDEVTALRADGYAVTLDQALPFLGGSGDDFSIEEYFGGYRSWDEHVDHLRAVAASNPGLAQVVDYGDSWRKVNGRAGGNDLLAICLTNRQPGDCDLRPDAAKPRAVIMAAIHARELVPAEVAYRLIDDLVAGYGTDAEITAILDTTEVWIIPVANPDGREIVELGGNAPYLQRKNANDTIGNCRRPPSASNQHGVDLNRNADYGWGGPGTSTNPCAQTYRGTAGASEPEQQALEALFADLWPSRPTAPGVPVPDSTTGTFITIHSYSDLILLPPGSGPLTPDDADLRALAFRMSDTNRYRVGTPPELLYSVSGSTDDWVYGRLGVASFTYEIGPSGGSCGGFTPPYRCVDADLYPRNRDALLYSLRVAGGPYTLPSGPTPDRPTVPGGTVSGTITVSAVFDDDAFGPASGSRGRPSAQDVVAAEVYVGAGPWEGGTPAAMAPTDGTFDSVREAATAQVSVDGLPAGQHPIYVRARDAAGDWGPVGAAFVTVEGAPTPTQGSISGTVVGDGGGRAGVAIDLFTADAGGSRGVYVATRTTGGDGTYTFDPIDPGCWVLTFIAPPGETFVGDDGWLDRFVCVEPGQAVAGVDAELATAAPSAQIQGAVREGSDGVAGVAVDQFEAAADGSRGAWLRTVRTGADGRFTLDSTPGCYVLTFIAPTGRTFTNGSPWFNSSVCVAAGETVTGIDARLAGAATSTLSGAVTRSGSGAPGVVVDLFAASADGSRGTWIGDATTSPGGGYRFDVEAGCYVLTFIAPAGQTFTDGSRWFEAPTCVADGEERTGLDASLTP